MTLTDCIVGGRTLLVRTESDHCDIGELSCVGGNMLLHVTKAVIWREMMTFF